MKKAGKLVSMLAATALIIGAFASAAGAEGNIRMVDPGKGDVCSHNTANIINRYANTEKSIDITGRTITYAGGSGLSITPIVYKLPYQTSSGGWQGMAASSYWKNNFTWEFDFKYTELPAAGKDFFILIGSNAAPYWKNKIQFIRAESGDTYRLQWGGTASGVTTDPAQSISSPDKDSWNTEKYGLKVNETYHLKIEADLANSGKVYITFTNPNVTDENNAAYTKLTESPYSVGDVYTAVSDWVNAGKYSNVMFKCNAALTLELSNEAFYMDRFRATVPSAALDGNKITVSETVVNTTNTAYWIKAPLLVGAVYDSTGKIVRTGYNDVQPASGFPALGQHDYSTVLYDLDKLANGTYTFKAFLWNSFKAMTAYPNCLVEKTLTVTNGTVTMAD